MTNIDIDLTSPKPTVAERLATHYRACRMAEPAAAKHKDPQKMADARVAVILAADALMTEVLTFPAGRPAETEET